MITDQELYDIGFEPLNVAENFFIAKGGSIDLRLHRGTDDVTIWQHLYIEEYEKYPEPLVTPIVWGYICPSIDDLKELLRRLRRNYNKDAKLAL